MKILKRILLVLAALIVLLLIVAAFLPSRVRVERTALIPAAPERVYLQVADMKGWEKWNPWMEKDPKATSSVSDPSTGVGAQWKWSGEEVGTGSMTVTQLVENRTVGLRLDFVEPWTTVADCGFTFRPEGTGTRVTWWFEEDMRWPLERYLGLMMDGMLGADFERGLTKLKTAVGSQS